MRLLTKETRYAVRALAYMAHLLQHNSEKLLTVETIADGENIPPIFLRKVFQVLAREGVLKSFKGKHGGFTFARKSEDISMFDIATIFQGGLEPLDCLLETKKCPRTQSCGLRTRMDELNHMLDSELKSITMKSLINH